MVLVTAIVELHRSAAVVVAIVLDNPSVSVRKVGDQVLDLLGRVVGGR